MTVQIARRPTLVDAMAQAGRWWWRYWERFFEAGGGLGSTAFTAEGAEYAGVEEDVGHAVVEDTRFRNLTGLPVLDHPRQRVQRVEAAKEDCPESLPPRGRTIAATRSAGFEGSVVERSLSVPSALSAVKHSSTPTPDPVRCD